MVEVLDPFIVTVWNGRSREDMPADVREVYEATDGRGIWTNIILFVLDSSGEVVDYFQPFPGKNPGSLGFDRDRMGGYIREQVERVGAKLDLSKAKPRSVRELWLPRASGAGDRPWLRIYVSFVRPKSMRMNSYRAPVVEPVALGKRELKALRYPEAEREIRAQELGSWFEQIYPPAQMSRSGMVEQIAGSLTLAPAGRDAQQRYAILTGDIAMVLDDRGATEYGGMVEIVLGYAEGALEPSFVRGVFGGIFPRSDRMSGRMHEIMVIAAIESVDDKTMDGDAVAKLP